jgi:glycerol-3-phosphate cytidylyltransferase-like family protein
MRIYFPTTCDIMTPGHIQSILWLKRRGELVIGVLTSKAMKGHKTEIIPFKARLFVLEAVLKGIGNVRVVSQSNIDPTRNLKRLKCDAMASGDPFDEIDQRAIDALGLKEIRIKLPSDKKKLYGKQIKKK